MKVKTIFGPPGTGKTTFLLDVLEKELQSVAPEEIAYVSFTREGSYQGRDRAVKKFDFKKNDFPFFRTLHSLAFRQLSLNRGQVIDKRHYKIFSDKMGMRFTGYYTEDMHHNDDRYLFFNILMRNNPRTAAKYIYDLDTAKLNFVRGNYRRFKEHYSLIDYTDMIQLFCEANQAVSVRVAIIDEAQDLTTLQWKMVWTAFKNCERVFIAGDDDQAIYEWSGADVDYFLSIEGEMEILRHSYRLPNNIVEFAKTITDCISHRITKEYRGNSKLGSIQRILDIRELDIDISQTWMFLSRNHVFLKGVEEFIRGRGLMYSYNGKPSIKKENIQAINMFEEMRKGSVKDYPKLVPHLKNKVDLNRPWYDNFKWDVNELAYYRDVIRAKTDVGICNIRINTIHSVKGAEADNVVVLLDITKQIDQNMNNNPDSEYRVLYVGCTRVKENLFIVESSTKYEYKIPTKSWLIETQETGGQIGGMI